MRKIAGFVLLCMLFSTSPTWADDKPGSRVDMRESETARSLVRVSVMDHARLMHDAGLRVRFLARRGPDSGALVDAIWGEPDPAAREAQWSAWLDHLAVSGGLRPVEIQALAALEETTPVVGIPHHEFPSRTMPAFALAARSGVLLARNAQLSHARKLAARPGELTEALEADVDSPAFASGLQALEFISPELLADVVAMSREGSRLTPAAARILLKAAEVAPEQSVLLSEVVRRGDAATARRALRLALERAGPQLPEIAAIGLARGEIGGLALTAARQSGMHPDAFCWALLGDPALGADAARLLAQESGRLLTEISARVDRAEPLARLRMLLALRLRGTDASREMLSGLVEAPWLSAQQRREIRSWL